MVAAADIRNGLLSLMVDAGHVILELDWTKRGVLAGRIHVGARMQTECSTTEGRISMRAPVQPVTSQDLDAGRKGKSNYREASFCNGNVAAHGSRSTRAPFATNEMR